MDRLQVQVRDIKDQNSKIKGKNDLNNIIFDIISVRTASRSGSFRIRKHWNDDHREDTFHFILDQMESGLIIRVWTIKMN